MKARDFSCSGCGFSSPQWFGRCPDCGTWSSPPQSAVADGAHGVDITSLAFAEGAPARLSTGIAEVDRVLGGGFVPGAVVLLAGEPGIGKSTLLLQALDGLLRRGRSCLLLSGEESVAQVALRARRVGIGTDRFRVAASASLPAVLAASEKERADVVVVDSIQTLEDPALPTGSGSVVQVRECAAALVRHAKESETVIVVVGHVTKDGGVAGPKTLEHLVDAVLTLEGERTGALRLLRATKNRFGSCEETGVFVMAERGLEAVEDASALLLADRRPGVPGSVVFPGLEGSRPVLVEIQALLAPTALPQPRRVAIGVDARRLSLLLGVLSERAELPVGERDVFVAAAGGLVVREPAADLALCLALFSASAKSPVDERLVAIGEVGLAGEVRRVPGCERRLMEAARLGFNLAIVPSGIKRVPDIRVLEADDVAAAFGIVRGGRALSAAS